MMGHEIEYIHRMIQAFDDYVKAIIRHQEHGGSNQPQIEAWNTLVETMDGAKLIYGTGRNIPMGVVQA